MNSKLTDLTLAYTGAIVAQANLGGVNLKLEIVKIIIGATIPLLIKELVIYLKNKKNNGKI